MKSMSDHEWDVKCKAAFLGLYAAWKLCRELGLDPHDLLHMVELQQGAVSVTWDDAAPVAVTAAVKG